MALRQLFYDCASAMANGSDRDLLRLLGQSKDLTRKLSTRVPYDLLKDAIGSGVIEFVEILLDHGFDLHKVINRTDVLGIACYSTDAMKLFLISRGIKLYTKDFNPVLNINDTTIQFLAEHFFIFIGYTLFLNPYTVKKMYTQNTGKLMKYCKLSLACKDRICRKLFFIPKRFSE